MKIWCCFCFSEEDEPGEEEFSAEELMEEKGSGNDVNSDGRIGIIVAESEEISRSGDGEGIASLVKASRRSKGESSSASSAVVSEDCDHDPHHKRAKVHSDFQ